MIEIVAEAAIEKIVDQLDLLALVQAAYVDTANGVALGAPVVRAPAGEPERAVNIKFGAAPDLIGGKIGTFWPRNRANGLDNHGATTLLLDPDTGYPAALIAARGLNRLRTAAGNALAVRALSRPDASVLALIGYGAQALFEARAVARVRTLDEIRIGVRNFGGVFDAWSSLRSLAKVVRVTSIAEAVRGADIIVTATSSRAPLVRLDWVDKGAHISAMGADARGKQELATDLAARARAFADWPAQSARIGEFQHACKERRIRPSSIKPLGDVLSGKATGRQSPEEITLFDSSGLAVQDLYVAHAALAAARAAGLVERIAF